jgi:hypothetical protein
VPEVHPLGWRGEFCHQHRGGDTLSIWSVDEKRGICVWQKLQCVVAGL